MPCLSSRPGEAWEKPGDFGALLSFKLYLDLLSLLASHHYANSGWWLTYPSEKYDFVSWDYEIHQPEWKVI